MVVHDIPANSVAAGNPCKVIREIGKQDQVPFNQEPRYHCDPDCGACYYSHYEDGLLICYHPDRVDN